MSRVAVLITDMFEDIEYTKPAEAFREAGHDLVHVGLSAGEMVHGKKENTPVVIDRGVSDVSVDEFDVLFIPGGYSPDKLRAHDAPVEFVRRFVESGKPILLICHAPQLLITAQVLEGRRITGWRSVAQDIRNPDDIPAFITASLAKLEEIAVAAPQ